MLTQQTFYFIKNRPIIIVWHKSFCFLNLYFKQIQNAADANEKVKKLTRDDEKCDQISKIA